MPVIPPGAGLPYDTVESALQSARVQVNDAMVSTSGEVLTDAAPFTQQLTNDAWRWLQSYLANLGYALFKEEVILYALPAVASSDPASQTFTSWSQFFDGVSFYTTAGYLLPQLLIQPLFIWERPTGVMGGFQEMHMCLDGIPARPKSGFNGQWEWRSNTLYMVGSQLSMDIRIRFAKYLPDFVTLGGTPWYQQQIPVMRGQQALAAAIAYIFSKPRGDLDSASFLADAESAARRIFNIEAAAKQRTTATRQGYNANRLRRGSYFTGS